ncbi:MAG TPA: hypothetical protein VFS31_09990, partial [Chitinophagaceae bacterium]|nr:hypothetical protein [Chitinophagaceae bacterium]
MIKQAVFLLVLFLSVYVCPAQDYDKLPGQKDRQSFGLKGLVRQLSEKQWRPAGDSLVVIGAKGIGPDSSYILERSDEAVFDSLGNMQSLVSNDPDERKRRALKQTVHYYYYQKERMSAIRIKEEGSPADSLAFTWRKNGQADHYSLYNGKNELQYKMTYAYKNGKLFTARKNDA